MNNNNKLIAEFMGWEFTLMSDTDGKCYTVKGSWDIIHEDDFIVDKGTFAYNTSWDWLMPVIDKCYQEHMSKHIADAVMTCNKDEAYQAVVEFIKTYNKTKL